MRTCLRYLWVYTRALLALIWEVVFWSSQIVTNAENLLTLICDFVAISDLRPWRGKLSPKTLKTCSMFLWVYPCSLLKWIREFEFFSHFGVILLVYTWSVCISVIKSIKDIPKKPSSKGPMSMWTCFRYLGVSPRALLISIWEVVFWTVTNCDSHKLRQIRKLCRHNLWFVAICDQGHAVVN